MGIFSQIKDKITQYIEVNVKLIKLNVIGKTAGVVSYLLFGFIALFIVFAIVIFLGMGISEALVDAGMMRSAAYFITMGVYILLLVIFLAMRKKVTGFFAGGVIASMTDDGEEGDDESAD